MTDAYHDEDADDASSLVRSVLRSEWARLRRAFRRATDLFPWRPLGVFLTLAAYAVLEYFAYARLDLVWLVVGYVALGLTLVCPLGVLATAVWLKVWWKLRGPRTPTRRPLVLETGICGRTGFSLPSLGWAPLVSCRWEWSLPRGPSVELRAAGSRIEEWVSMHDRGHFESIERRVFVEDPFGVSRIVVRVREEVVLDVRPRLGGLRNLPPLPAFASGDALPHPLGFEDGDRMDLRRYNPGDPARWIHWKLLGRTRKLMVRIPERALTPARRTAAFLVAGPDDDASAALACLALERGMFGAEWVFGTDAEDTTTERVDDAVASLVRSSGARPRGGAGLAAFVERAEAKGPASVLLFVPPRPGAWVDRVASFCARRKVSAVIGIDGVVDRERPPWWKRLFWFWSEPGGTPAAALVEVMRSLSGAGVEVVVIERETGRRLTDEHREAMRRFELHLAVPPPRAGEDSGGGLFSSPWADR